MPSKRRPTPRSNEKKPDDPQMDDGVMRTPSLAQWMKTFGVFREELSRQYEKADKWNNDTEFCSAKGLSRAQFSRVMQGTERPSPTILAKLNEEFSSTFKECERQWLEDEATDDVRRLVGNMRSLMGTGSYPGTYYVLTSRPLERDSDLLLQMAADFLEDDPGNKLTFIVGNFDEEWKQQFAQDQIPNSDRLYQWPVVDTKNIGRYIEAVLDHLKEKGNEHEFMKQINCIRFSYLEIAQVAARSHSKLNHQLAELSAPLLSPFTIFMLYHGKHEELLGYIFFRCGNNYRWYPLLDDDAKSLRDYVLALLDFQKDTPEVIKPWPIENLSHRLKRLKNMSDTVQGGKP